MKSTSLSAHFKKVLNIDKDNTDLSYLSVSESVDFHPIVKISNNKPVIDLHTIQQPLTPKEQVPSKASYIKNIRFNPYKSTKPDLLHNIQLYHKLEEQKLLHIYEDHNKIPTKEWNDIYSNILDKYIDNSTIYQNILQKSKKNYDLYINELINKIETSENIDQILDNKDKEFDKTLEKSLRQSKLKIKELQKTIDTQANTITNIVQELDDVKLNNRLYLDQVNNLKKELSTNKSKHLLFYNIRVYLNI